jgi:uncharacterized lipoprotein
MKGNSLRIRAAAAAALLLCACALSPQVVSLKPDVNPARVPPAPNPDSVALTVTDARKSQTVGYRGGVYDTASITTAPGTEDAIRAVLERALAERGYRIAQPGDEADIELRVELAELNYATRPEGVKRVVETAATVRAVSTRGDTTRRGEYRDSRTTEVLKPPDEAGNAELLNTVLSAALERLVADPQLLYF